MTLFSVALELLIQLVSLLLFVSLKFFNFNSSKMNENNNNNVLTFGVDEIIRQSPFLISSFYALTVIAFVPVMLFVFDNYKMVSNKLRIQIFLLIGALIMISIVSFSLNFGLIGIAAYSLADGNGLVILNRPLSFMKIGGVGRYCGTIVIHHFYVLGLLIMIDTGVIQGALKHYGLLQVIRVMGRVCSTLLYFCNKDWKNPTLPLLINGAIFLIEILSVATAVVIIGPKGLMQVIFTVLDYELSVALNKQRKGIISSDKDISSTSSLDKTNKNNDQERTITLIPP